MKRRKIGFIIVTMLLTSVVAGYAVSIAASEGAQSDASPAISVNALANRASSPQEEPDLSASGFIEAEEVAIAPELGGRVIALPVDEGDEVEAGGLLVQLDSTLLEAHSEVAQAALDVTEAQLAQVKAGARPEQIRKAELSLSQAKIYREGICQAWQDALAIRDNPQELTAQIVQAQARVNAAEAGLAQAVALKDAAEIADDRYWDGREELEEAEDKLEKIPEPMRPSLPGLQLDAHLIPNVYWKSWVGVNTAQAALDGAKIALSDLYAMRNNPQELNAQVDAIGAQCQAADETVQMAQARLDALRKGATAQEIAIAATQVDQARAALNALDVQRDKLSISAPVGGVILECMIHKGELAVPGVSMLTLADLDKVTLTIYVPEDRLGQVYVGQAASVSVDSFPRRTFEGAVVAIAQEAEFTPRNVQTQEERVNMVFAVDIKLPNPEHALKPGMPADAVIRMQER